MKKSPPDLVEKEITGETTTNNKECRREGLRNIRNRVQQWNTRGEIGIRTQQRSK